MHTLCPWMHQTARFASLTLALLAANPAQAALDLAAQVDSQAGRAAFLATGTGLATLSWDTLLPNGTTQTPGLLGWHANVTHLTVAAAGGGVNEVVGHNGMAQALAPGNWLDGSAFDRTDGSAATDLAVNGSESFDLVFSQGQRAVGFAVATGMGNLPNEVDLAGASFEFTALDALNQTVGSASFSLAPGAPAQFWLTLSADRAFTQLQVREVNIVSIFDQYFSDIHTSVTAVSSVPEPAALLTWAAGLLSLGPWRRRGNTGRRTPAA